MKVDFNNLRKQTAFALDDVIKTLNSGILAEKIHAGVEINGQLKFSEGDLLIFAEDLQKEIDHLRSCIWTLLCCYEEGNPDYRTVFEEVEQSGGLARFNTDED